MSTRRDRSTQKEPSLARGDSSSDHAGRLRAGAAARRAPLAVAGVLALLVAAGCSDAASPHPPPPPPPPPPNEIPAPPVPVCTGLEAVCNVPLPTYDGSGQLVHPDVAVF